MNLFDVIFDWKSISTMYDRMQAEYKIMTEVREYLAIEYDCREPVIGNNVRERDYRRLLDAPKLIESYKEENRELREEIEHLRFMNAELIRMKKEFEN